MVEHRTRFCQATGSIAVVLKLPSPKNAMPTAENESFYEKASAELWLAGPEFQRFD